MLLFLPTLSVEVSGNTIWVEPLADVSTRSLCTTLVPITSVRWAAPGGVPVEAGFTAPTLPAFCASTRASGAVVDINSASRRVRYLWVRSKNGPGIGRPSEAHARPGQHREIVLSVMRQGG